MLGHRQGIRSVRAVVEEGCRLGLEQLTLFCLSVENWKRPPRELKFLMRLLRHFLENPQRVFSRQQLLEAVWPHSEEIELRTVDVHVRRLRLALATDHQFELIRTVRSEGYSLDADGVA